MQQAIEKIDNELEVLHEERYYHEFDSPEYRAISKLIADRNLLAGYTNDYEHPECDIGNTNVIRADEKRPTLLEKFERDVEIYGYDGVS